VKNRYCHLVSLLMCLLMVPAVHAQTSSMRLSTLEWPPYVSASLPDEGLTTSLVKTVASQAGIATSISYAPWSRAVQVGSNDPSYAGYFPAFYLPEREKTCYFSGEIGHSVIGFAYLKPQAFQWNTLADLRGQQIGTVQAYANGEEFDAMVRQGLLKTDIAPSDISNLRKLLAKRISVAVIDRDVLRQLLITEASLQADKDRIVFHPRELTTFSMRICFQRTESGQALQKAFDAELKKVNIKKLENAYFQRLSRLPPARE
jgi:polar amino acid transport system substrate-binding protein